MTSYNQKKNTRPFSSVFVLLLIVVLIVAAIGFFQFTPKDGNPQLFVGVDVGYGDANTVLTIANAISGFSNLIIIGSTAVTANTSELTKVCDYLYIKGFYFMVYVGFSNANASLPPNGPDATFFQMASSKWGTKFLGAYMFDEAGGKQISAVPVNVSRPVITANSYSHAAARFIIDVQSYLTFYKDTYYSVPQMKLYTSDYNLYWYDYISGYDVVFSEIFGSSSDQLSIAMDRGAAHSQGKQWGAIVDFSPSSDNSSHTPVYNDVTLFYNTLVMAYQNSASYILVFDGSGSNTHPESTPYGVLSTDHLNAMKTFWNYTQKHPQQQLDPAQTAYVLPTDYAYGFRNSNDTIWGLFPADVLSATIWNDTNNLLSQYGSKLDIVYETKTDGVLINLPYKTLIFWNGTKTQT